ncbi:type II toxin-antitoxin system VapC family toxin [Ollibium composti]|uniref:Type II toxin-antitoxin system VapC family toxin n=1 Tax=Ollibium composti TaxID=2675109 RepID=A0ABY2Q4E8_9HYPH|nr:type II toxin-antitoxin system VapC family toxin [Mesorhizobium composti]THF55686.1 type II toxin-antitoxin system VapC family toxin [Mesorhizobium composti]
MRLLLDTHIAVWTLTEPKRIPARFMDMIGDTENAVAVSAAAVWEIAIKHRLHRPDSPPFSGHEAIGHFENAGFSLMNVTPAHAAFVERLPPLHGDPFDRLMLAQAIIENMQLVTYDRHLSRYDVGILTWP